MARLFLATLLIEANISSLQVVKERLTELEVINPERLRWTTDSKLHLTWLFFGNLDQSQLIELQNTLNDFPGRIGKVSKTAELSLDRAEIWHSDNIPKHLVLTPSAIPNEFNELAAMIRDSFLPFVDDNFKRQAQRAPRPHVTIAHFKKHNAVELQSTSGPPSDNHPLQNGDPSLVGLLLPIAFANPLPLILNSLALVESSNDGGTNRYRTIEKVSLGDLSAS
jgi:2'-5' RNA ligase